MLDEYVRAFGLPSRSAGVQQAIRLLRHGDLDRDYTAAWDDWQTSGQQAAWDVAVADGSSDASR